MEKAMQTKPSATGGNPAAMLCPHFGVCGGCSRQDVAYAEQLRAKEVAVRAHLAAVPAPAFRPILASPETVYYRNKMEFSFGDERDRRLLARVARQEPASEADTAVDPFPVHLGLHPRKRFNLVTPTPDCRLISPQAQSVLRVVASWATEHRLPAYLRKDNSGVLRHLILREGKNTGERLVNLVSTSALRQADDLARRLKEAVLITTFLWTVHDGLSDVAKGEVRACFWGEGFIRERVGELLLRVPPESFMQTNTHAFERLLRLLRDWTCEDAAGRETGHGMLDLYCGSGAIGLNLAGQFSRVFGVELDRAAIEEARYNAAYNGILRAEFIHGRAEDVMSVVRSASEHASTIVVDPPRAGLHRKVADGLAAIAPRFLYYLSCNPESLARDLRILTPRFEVAAVQPIDFFPHTDHVETLVRLRRREGA